MGEVLAHTAGLRNTSSSGELTSVRVVSNVKVS
jgi:hypothetical protein